MSTNRAARHSEVLPTVDYTIPEKALPEHTSTHAKPSKSWRAPSLILAGLICGLAFALGHNFFYQSFDSRQVSEVSISQSWIIRVGTFLAFLSKLSFGISISVAFVQLQWYKLRVQSATVRDLDSISTMLHSFLSFVDGAILRYPLLALVALVCWLLPLVPVITSGTISVIQVPVQNVTQGKVPQLNLWNNTVHWGANEIYVGGDFYPPSSAVSQNSIATAMAGKVLPATPVFTNSSYTIQFLAPSISCQDANSSFVDAVSSEWLRDSEDVLWSYISWVPGDTWTPGTTNSSITPGNIDMTLSDNSRLFIATIDPSSLSSGEAIAQQHYNVTECIFSNASYTVKFVYQEGVQTIDIENVAIVGNLSFGWLWQSGTPLTGYAEDDFGPNGRGSYSALAASLGSLLNGAQQYDIDDDGRATYFTSINLLHFSQDKNSVQLGVEQLFQNMIMSMFSRYEFMDNNTAQVDIQVSFSGAVYAYDSKFLILTYGLALLFTLIATIIGFFAFFKNEGESYQNIFSSFLRATSGADIHSSVSRGDSGGGPLPRNLAEAKLSL